MPDLLPFLIKKQNKQGMTFYTQYFTKDSVLVYNTNLLSRGHELMSPINVEGPRKTHETAEIQVSSGVK